MARWRQKFRRYGSIRILRDDRVRFSPWTFAAPLSYIGFQVGGHIEMERFGRPVMEFDVTRGRILSANFRYDVTPDELRSTVSDLCKARHGLERWIVPALELTCLARSFREENPDTYAAARELLDSCQDLPVAASWKRHRATVYANHGVPVPDTSVDKNAPVRKSRGKSKAAQPMRRSHRST